MTIKQLTRCLILPVTIISFGTFTKWWYVLPDDAPDTMMSGFPLAFISDGWHTSMSLQIFILELVVDFLFYFLIWFLLIILIHHYIIQIKIAKILTGILWILSTIIFVFAIWISSLPDQVFKIKRDWNMQVLVTGFKFVWKYQDRPDIGKYLPEKK